MTENNIPWNIHTAPNHGPQKGRDKMVKMFMFLAAHAYKPEQASLYSWRHARPPKGPNCFQNQPEGG